MKVQRLWIVLIAWALCVSTISSVMAARYVDNGNGSVTDTKTGLMWQQSDDGAGQSHVF